MVQLIAVGGNSDEYANDVREYVLYEYEYAHNQYHHFFLFADEYDTDNVECSGRQHEYEQHIGPFANIIPIDSEHTGEISNLKC